MSRTFPLPGGARLVVKMGDLTREDVDAIVNAANAGLLGGGGVDGAIHRAAGPELVEACRALPKRNGIRCPPGEARITPGFALRARHVIHTVGPIYDRSPDPEAALASAVRASLDLARAHQVRTIAFPAISCGVYGFPLDDAATVIVETIAEHAADVDEVRLVLYGPEARDAFLDAAEARLGS